MIRGLISWMRSQVKPSRSITPGAEVLDQDVAALQQLGEDLLALVGLHVEGEAALVAVEHREVEAVDVRQVAQLAAGDVPAARAARS